MWLRAAKRNRERNVVYTMRVEWRSNVQVKSRTDLENMAAIVTRIKCKWDIKRGQKTASGPRSSHCGIRMTRGIKEEDRQQNLTMRSGNIEMRIFDVSSGEGTNRTE